MTPAAFKHERAPFEAPAPLWQSSAQGCALCAGRRRDYLFVTGGARMTRCHECGLVSRTGGPPAAGALSYALDADGCAAVLAGLPAGRVLEVLGGGPSLGAIAGREIVTVDLGRDPAQLEGLVAGSYDSAVVNGLLEHADDPVALLRSVLAALKPGAVLTLLAGAHDIARLPAGQLPRHSFTPATLLRVAQAAGFRTESCGLLERSLDTRPVDARLVERAPFERTTRLFGALTRRPVRVQSGVLALRATVSPPRPRPKLSIIMPVFNEARTFTETFHAVHGAVVEGVDRELIVVESNSTDGSRQQVQAIEGLPGVRVVYEDRPSGKGHAVRQGLAVADGDILLIQDADQEYDVADYDIVLEPLLRLSATFVLGSRHMGGRTWKIRQFANARAIAGVMNLAHQFFTVLTNWLYAADMRDPTTMYKVFRRECLPGIAFRRDRFDFDFELVCKLIRRGHVPVEVPINYRSRSYAEGKKVRFFRDPLTWLRTIVASRFEPLLP